MLSADVIAKASEPKRGLSFTFGLASATVAKPKKKRNDRIYR